MSKQDELRTWDFSRLTDYAEAYILKAFINEGGKGFHSAVWLMLQLALQWDKEQKR